MSIPKLALFISGGASTAARIIDECMNGVLQAKIEPVCVIASRRQIAGVDKMRQRGFCEENGNLYVVRRKDFADGDVGDCSFGEEILSKLRLHEVKIVGQYGWLSKTPKNVIQEFLNRIINQHPGPLDPSRLGFGGEKMYGSRVHAARLLYVKRIGHDFWTEATAHHVTEEYDQGKLIATRVIEIDEDILSFDPCNDDELRAAVEKLQSKVLAYEHDLQVEVLNGFAQRGKFEGFVRDKPLITDMAAYEYAKTRALELFS